MALRSAEFSALKEVFASRNFAIYTLGNSFSLLGLWVHRFALGLLTWELTGSGFWLGAIAFADSFPIILIGVFSGLLADWFNRRKIVLICQSLNAIFAALICGLTATGLITIEILVAIAFCSGCAVAIQQPSRLALVHGLVPEKDFATAVAVNSLSFNAARFVGPALGGIITGFFGIAPAFAVNSVSYISLIVALMALQLPAQNQRAAGSWRDAPKDLLEGFRHAFSHPLLRTLLTLSMIVGLFARPVIELLPGFADAIFNRPDHGLAFFMSAHGVGAIIGGTLIMLRGRAVGLGNIAVIAALLSGLMASAFASTNIFVFGVLAMAGVGCFAVSFGITAQTLLQITVTGEIRGRVLGIWAVVSRGMPAVGAMVMGSLSEFFGLSLPILVGGLICALYAAPLWRKRRLLAPQSQASVTVKS